MILLNAVGWSMYEVEHSGFCFDSAAQSRMEEGGRRREGTPKRDGWTTLERGRESAAWGTAKR